MVEENSSCVNARQNHKQKLKGKKGTGGYREHRQEEKTVVARPRVAHEQG